LREGREQPIKDLGRHPNSGIDNPKQETSRRTRGHATLISRLARISEFYGIYP
jgi:hypothetical protein